VGLVEAANIALAKGETQEAKKLLLLGERKKIINPDLHKRFGKLYEKMAMPERALLHYQSYLKARTDAPDRNDITKQIHRLEYLTED